MNLTAPNLVKMYVTLTLIMDLIGPELPELPSLCLQTNICKYKPINTKLGHNIYEHKIFNEFDYGSSLSRTTGVMSS